MGDLFGQGSGNATIKAAEIAAKASKRAARLQYEMFQETMPEDQGKVHLHGMEIFF